LIENFTSDSVGADGSIYIERNNDRMLGWQYRIDSINVYYLPERLNVNWLCYKLDADSGDVWIVKDMGNGFGEVARIEEIFYAFIFGIPSIIKKIGYYMRELKDTTNFTSWLESHYIASGFGLVLVEAEGTYYNYVQKLRGCIINGVAYGSLVNVTNDALPVSEFILQQNYPNPFNSQTRIEYRLPENSFVNLEVYDILGQRIKTLVSENKPAGSHSIEFNADGLTAGTYIYCLFNGKHFITRQMIYLK